MPRILAVSGSPAANSNIDRAIKTILEASGQPFDFIKLSKKNVRPCIACLGCVDDNHCKQKDDYSSSLEELALRADVWIIGGWPPFGAVDGFTKAFCERTYSLRHLNVLTRGKKGIIVAGGSRHQSAVRQFLQGFFLSQGIELLGTLELGGNVTCLTCGHGEVCTLSNVKRIWGPEATVTPDKFWRFEEHQDVVDAAREIGRKINLS